MAEPQSHEWSSPTTGGVPEYKPELPKTIGRLSLWYLTRAFTLFALVAALLHLQVSLYLRPHIFGIAYSPIYGFDSYSMSIYTWWKFSLMFPLSLAILFYFLKRPTLRVIAYGTSALSGAYLSAVAWESFHHYYGFRTGFSLLLGFDLGGFLFCFYSALHLTAAFLVDTRRRQAIEQGLTDPTTADKVELPLETEPHRRGRSILQILLRLSTTLPLVTFLPLMNWMKWRDWGWYSIPEIVRVWGYGIGFVFMLALFTPSRTLRLVGSGAGIVMGLYTLVFAGLEILKQTWFAGNSFRWGYEGVYAGIFVGALGCIAAGVAIIRQTIRFYRPEKIFLPGRDDLDEFDGIGRWDEGGR